MVEGFWSVQFQAGSNYGGGVAVFHNNKIYGGDAEYAYMGTYEVSNGKVKAAVTATAFTPGTPTNVFGTHDRQFAIDLVGGLVGESLEVRGTNMPISMKLTKRSNLQ